MSLQQRLRQPEGVLREETATAVSETRKRSKAMPYESLAFYSFCRITVQG